MKNRYDEVGFCTMRFCVLIVEVESQKKMMKLHGCMHAVVFLAVNRTGSYQVPVPMQTVKASGNREVYV